MARPKNAAMWQMPRRQFERRVRSSLRLVFSNYLGRPHRVPAPSHPKFRWAAALSPTENNSTLGTPSSDRPSLRSSRKVAFASLIGTTIEWYDFFIFGTAAALIFNKVFFPSFDPVTGTLAAFASFSVGFIARPFGGAVFAHYGDKIGRKPMLVYSLLLMGAATVLMGLLPGYASIGIWAPMLLVVLRFAQGFGVGGEWGGAALMAVEHAPEHRRGFYGAWPQVGVPAGLVLGTATYALLSATLSDEQFLEWGWRVPFLASALLIAVGMWIRLAVAESPIFQEALDAKSAAKMPVLDALKTYPKEIALAAGSFVATNATFYVVSVWLISYATTKLGYDRTDDPQRQRGFEPVRHPDDPGLWPALGLHRPPQNVPHRHGRARPLRGPLLHAGVDLQHLAVHARRPHRPGLSLRSVRAAVGLLRRAVLHQNALQRLLTGLPVRRDPRGHGAADLHRAHRYHRQSVFGRCVRHRHRPGLAHLLLLHDVALRTA